MDNRINFRKSHSRTKWGGNREDIGKSRIEGEWYCQICGDKQVEGIDPYFFEAFPGDYLRICPTCFHFFKQGIDTFQEIKEMSAKFHKAFLDNQ